MLIYVTGEGVVLPAGLTELKLDCSIFEGRIIRQHMTSNPLQYMQLRWVLTWWIRTFCMYTHILFECVMSWSAVEMPQCGCALSSKRGTG